MKINELLANWQESVEKANLQIEDGECREDLLAVAGLSLRSRIQAGEATTMNGNTSCWGCHTRAWDCYDKLW